MSIRFKFRSSVNFDTVEIGERGSITVGELRAKILKGKNSQQQQQGFDLVFSDSVSGLEFKGDGCHISSGSSVIVRRVPAGTLSYAVSPFQAVKDVGVKESHNTNPASAPVDEFDDLGADLCPVPDSFFPDFNLEFDNNDVMDNEKDKVTCLRLGRENNGPGDLSQLIPTDCDQSGNEKNILPRADQLILSNKLPTSNLPVEQCTNLPVEMKCPLCNTFFKEAVMIPCCQHSFCQNCIRHVLIVKGRCPKCFSSKCNVENLLPNLSLRQAIEHFLEAQMHDAGLENAMQKYVPDGESGIQAKEFSCALSVVQKDLELHQSSSATGKGSNQVYMEAFYEQHRQRNVPFVTSGNRDIKSSFPSQKVNQIDNVSGYPRPNDMRRSHGDLEPSADFQGENQPVIPPANVHYEAESNTKRQGGFWIDSGSGDRNFSGLGGHRKGVRNCYTCGSPDHLMRDCPMSHPNPMYLPGNGAFHGGMPGYGPPYWNGSSMPPFRSYPNIYGNPAMIHFNAPMVPVSPFAAPPPYFPSMGGGHPGPGGNMRMGNMGPPHHSENFVLQHCENKRKRSCENLGRENISDEDENEDDSPERYRHKSMEKLHDHRPPKDAKPSLTPKEVKPTLSRSDDSLGRRSGGKSHHDKGSRSSYSGRDRRPSSHGERSISGKEDVSRSSEGRHKHHHGESKKYHHDRKGHCESELSYGHHKDIKRRVEPDVKGSYKGHKERELDRGYSRHAGKHSREEHRGDRWQAANNGFDDDRRDEYRYHKRKAH